MVYSASSDLDALFEAYTGNWSNGDPTIYRGGVEDEPDTGDTSGYIRVNNARKNAQDTFSNVRYDEWSVIVEPYFNIQDGTETKILARCKDIQDCIDAENATGDRTYFMEAILEKYDEFNATMVIRMREGPI